MFIPNRFLLRVEYAVPYVAAMPDENADELIDLPPSARLDPLAALDQTKTFAEVSLGWNETGLGVVVVVRGKSSPPVGDASRPTASDGVTLWIDTRGDRSAHRAGRTCHQFHLLPTGGGSDRDEPVILQTKIHRATDDAPLQAGSALPFRSISRRGGYRLEAFLPAGSLNGFDPEEYPRMGFGYAIHDQELGEQILAGTGEFPFGEDPSLWCSLILKKED
jgi:hypothetical protein